MTIPNNPGAGELGYEPVVIKDDDGYEFDSFITPDHYKKYLQRILIPQGLIKSRVERMAFDISRTYNGEEFHLVCLLKGSRSFFTSLLKYLDRIHNYYIGDVSTNSYREHYVRVKSYCNTQSTGRLEIVSEDLSCLKGKNVLIVEDIIDTGNTLSKFCEYLKKFEPKTIAVSALYLKRTPLWNGFKADFTGFSVPNFFLVGCGLDYNENFRDLNHVCIIADDGIKAFMQPSS